MHLYTDKTGEMSREVIQGNEKKEAGLAAFSGPIAGTSTLTPLDSGGHTSELPHQRQRS